MPLQDHDPLAAAPAPGAELRTSLASSPLQQGSLRGNTDLISTVYVWPLTFVLGVPLTI